MLGTSIFNRWCKSTLSGQSLKELEDGARDAHKEIVRRRRARLDHEYSLRRVLREPRREHRAREAAAHDNVVELAARRHNRRGEPGTRFD